MFEGSVRVPLMVHWPAHKLEERKIISDNISHVDLVPTLLDAAGIESPEYMAGMNMLPLMKDKESWEDHSVYSEYYSRNREPSQLMLRKGDYKFVYTTDTPSGAWETHFYNVSEDPWEMNDGMEDSQYADILLDYIDELMNKYFQEAGKHVPDEMPEIVPRVTYDIDWPADPWKAVKIHR